MKHIPFPQANNLDLIFDIIMDIGNTGLTKSDVAEKYHMEERQGSYYLDALLYLGFVEKIHSKYFLTKKGITIKELPAHMRKKAFVDEILKHPYIKSLWDDSVTLNKEKKQIYISNRLFNELSMADSTAWRRASTVVSWFERIKEITKSISE